VTETAHTRSRRASLGGLLVQLVAFGGTLALSFASHSQATFALAWYVLGGVPIWFVTLLVFRQRELAALEALDLEELRREKQATGGGEALFGGEGGAGLAFRVAEARLRWMQRWLVPGFGLFTGVYLGVLGLLMWWRLARNQLGIGSGAWPALDNVPPTTVVLAIIMVATFLLSRYASGMGRVADWQLLRGCGAYLLGNTLAMMGLLVCLGVYELWGTGTWEQALAYVIPVMMLALAAEVLLNFVLDIYRPRAAGVEPRACFDSRLLGLIAEPGGIAHTIAEAVNYQFGFQVSQTWFYQLLQRTAAPLVAVGGLALWLLTCVVIVKPGEHVVLVRLGQQLHAEDPWGPGLYWKLPWPIDRAQAFDTGQLHQIRVGFADEAANPTEDADKGQQVWLWTDKKHLGLEHFEFLVCPTPRDATPTTAPATAPAIAPATGGAWPVHLIRMEVVVQYRIVPEHLREYTRYVQNPDDVIRNMAWQEVVQLAASSSVEMLMGPERERIGETLRGRLGQRVAPLGLAVVYVGVTNVHPEMTVAQAYRNVIGAELEKVAEIRKALVFENQKLSEVAGDVQLARALAREIGAADAADKRQFQAAQALRDADAAVVEALQAKLAEHEPVVRERVLAAIALRDAELQREQVKQDYELGLGKTLEAQAEAERIVAEKRAGDQAAAAKLESALTSWRTEALTRLAEPQVQALRDGFEGHVVVVYWQEQLAAQFTPARLQGKVAKQLADALADRWQIEMKAVGDLASANNEREAYRVAPRIYKARRLIDVLVAGLKDSRKYFLAFDPGNRKVRVRFVLEDEPVRPEETIGAAAPK